VRFIAKDSILDQLDNENIVLLSNLGEPAAAAAALNDQSKAICQRHLSSMRRRAPTTQ
jgi:hypothetical protein